MLYQRGKVRYNYIIGSFILSIIFIIFLIFLVAKALVQVLLELLNLKTIVKNKNNQEIREVMPQDTLEKTIHYSQWKAKFSLAKIIYSAVVLYLVISLKIIPEYYHFLSNFFSSEIVLNTIFIFSFMALYSLVSLPLSWFNTFVIETKFGFNKMSQQLFFFDLLKSIILSFILFAPLMVLIFYGIELLPNNWWLAAFFIFTFFQILLQFIFPKFVLPLFNKLTPVEDEGLRNSINDLAQKLSFSAKEIMQMDGSKRSKHSNAFFTGFGKSRRVVFFDTLIDQLSLSELRAVFAHEVGHYKKKHILYGTIQGIFMSLIAFKVIHYLTLVEAFGSAFFLTPGNIAQVFLLFVLISGLVSFWVSPLFNFLSRKNEYEADAYAKENLGEGENLVSALKKLYLENLSNLEPHPWYSFFYYSHPTFFQRKSKLLN